jgi:hypothetical protein
MRNLRLTFALLSLAYVFVAANTAAQNPAPAQPAESYSGMYSFLQDGEFVQITIEDAGHVTGFISRYGDSESDRGTFLDHFFKQGKLEGQKLSFTTQIVHGVSFEFNGIFDRGAGKTPADEAYYLLKGTLVESTTDANQKTSAKPREVTFKSFPKET